MILGVIADDFTGASDVANTLVKQGMSTSLVINYKNAKLPQSDACVIGLKTRSVHRNLAITESLGALQWLRAQGCQQFFFKYCSTFDSTPEGNIGPVAEALASALNAKGVICCPAFPGAGRRVFQGHLFVGDKLLSESGMQKHPLNPMTDSDIRRWLALQSVSSVGHLSYELVQKGAEALKTVLALSAHTLMIADAVSDADLMVLGKAAAGMPLVTGGSGLALGLPQNFRGANQLIEGKTSFEGLSGPAVILAGSCSNATRAQITNHAKIYPTFKIDVNKLMTGSVSISDILNFALQNADMLPLIYSADDIEEINSLQRIYGTKSVADALDRFFGELAVELTRKGFNRVVVAGGETSGAVVNAIKISAFEVGPEIAPGVPCLRSQSTPTIAMALKSGNFGDANFFSKAVKMLGTEKP